MNSGTIQAETVLTRRSGTHPHCVEGLSLYHLVKGRARWSVDGRTVDFREGEVMVIMPGSMFSGVMASDSVLIRVEQVILPPGAVRSATSLGRCLGLEQATSAALIQGLAAGACRPLRTDATAAGLFSEIIHHAGSDATSAQVHLRLCVAHLLSSICVMSNARKRESGAKRSVVEARVLRFLQQLERRCEEPWRLDEMAEAAGLKRSRFGTLCRRLTGESPSVYLNRLRIRKGRRLLRDTRRTVTEIAFDCGFESSQYFAKVFRHFQGHEPTHYRRLAAHIHGRDGGLYLKGDTDRVVAFAEKEIGAGAFRIEGEIALDRLGDTAASLEFGRDRFGFDGREGRFFLEGETFGRARFFQHSAEVIREGIPFRFVLARQGRRLSMTVDGCRVVGVNDDPGRAIGRVGLRPLRNGIHVSRFCVDGQTVSLRHVDER